MKIQKWNETQYDMTLRKYDPNKSYRLVIIQKENRKLLAVLVIHKHAC